MPEPMTAIRPEEPACGLSRWSGNAKLSLNICTLPFDAVSGPVPPGTGYRCDPLGDGRTLAHLAVGCPVLAGRRTGGRGRPAACASAADTGLAVPRCAGRTGKRPCSGPSRRLLPEHRGRGRRLRDAVPGPECRRGVCVMAQSAITGQGRADRVVGWARRRGRSPAPGDRPLTRRVSAPGPRCRRPEHRPCRARPTDRPHRGRHPVLGRQGIPRCRRHGPHPVPGTLVGGAAAAALRRRQRRRASGRGSGGRSRLPVHRGVTRRPC